jgi:hypothetical protein
MFCAGPYPPSWVAAAAVPASVIGTLRVRLLLSSRWRAAKRLPFGTEHERLTLLCRGLCLLLAEVDGRRATG